MPLDKGNDVLEHRTENAQELASSENELPSLNTLVNTIDKSGYYMVSRYVVTVTKVQVSKYLGLSNLCPDPP